jgi:hypothetical protein
MGKELLTAELLQREYCENLRSQNDIAKMTDTTQPVVSEALSRHGIQARASGPIVNIVGKRFGRLVPQRPVFKRESGTSFRWECLCDCGNVVRVATRNLVDGLTKSCGCLKREKQGSNHQAWKGHGSIPATFLSKYRNHAKRRRIEFDLSIEYLDAIFVEQDGKCAISGIPLSLEHYGYRTGCNASIDRIDSSKGYVPGNVWWVDKRVNIAKQELSTEQFVELCQTVVRYQNAA